MQYWRSALSQKAGLRTNLRLCEAAVLLADLFEKLS
jgi:hypothetical protein